MSDINKYLSFSKEVTKAIENHKPIVALESTIISHGMPYPQNVEVAKRCEQVVRDNGCIPATIAIIKGKIKIGLDDDDLEYLGKTGRNITKVSRRDIAYVVALGLDGATTVSATMYLASLANIKIFATGGIGGVHRGASETFDISADLEELGKTDVCVVCAGAKAILDLPKTLEYLETKGVLVLGYKTKYLPAFYTSKSDYKVDYEISSPKQIADILNTKWDLGIHGSVLVTNPVSREFELDEKVMNKAIDEALIEMDKQNIKGKEATPYLLAKICEITKGDSLDANIHLVLNNCDLASKIAKHLYE
ncbi:MAG: pseudouridine-5'-phosphate glycosidase [Bacilli bacterium]|nr:pseudouridine-5'-phosphate glycosidase [Bacilli bacterium]